MNELPCLLPYGKELSLVFQGWYQFEIDEGDQAHGKTQVVNNE
jgi:hypothetical protein